MNESKKITISEMKSGKIRVEFGNKEHFDIFMKARRDEISSKIKSVVWDEESKVQASCPHCKKEGDWCDERSGNDEIIECFSEKINDIGNLAGELKEVGIDPSGWVFYKCNGCGKIFRN